MLVPIKPLGHGAFGSVHLCYHLDEGLVAVKIVHPENFDAREWKTSISLSKLDQKSIFIRKYLRYYISNNEVLLLIEYSNMKTLELITKHPQIQMPSYTLRALMKQMLEGLRVFHLSNLVHRDIKCDNILLHSPVGSGRVYAKLSDFGFTKKVDQSNEQTYPKGAYQHQAPELFQGPVALSQKIDIYAIGVTFYQLIFHKLPIQGFNRNDYKMKMLQMKRIERPQEIKDDILWDLLSQLLEFEPDKRITAEQALQHSYFTSPEALADISPEQNELAQQAIVAVQKSNTSISEFDKDPTFIVAESEIKKFIQTETRQTQSNQYSDGPNYSESKSLHLYSSQEYNKSSSQSYSSSAFKYLAKYLITLYSRTMTDEQSKVQKDLLEQNMTMEQIKEKLEKFSSLSLLERDVVCVNLIKQLKENKQGYQTAQQLGIFDLLLKILNTFDVDELYPIIYEPIITIIVQVSEEQIKDLVKSGYINWMQRMLISPKAEILWDAVYAIRKTTRLVAAQIDIGKENPLYEELQRNDIMKKLIEIFHSQDPNIKKISEHAAVALGLIFKATKIEGQLGEEIIHYNKQLTKESDPLLSNDSIFALALLAENQENHGIILSGNYAKQINDILLVDTDIKFYIRAIQLSIRLYKLGTREIREQLMKFISISRIEQLSSNKTEMFCYYPINMNEELRQLTSKFLDMVKEQKEER
ncbi:MAG: putative Serine/threonine-protein kinase ATG1a [Streblomastix strix]|uniref:Putative Serine/threonine-protein kinase ATG1a n=1 Tax=Streblomastix strix TaxID=222440 RepID=A0A5J4V9Y1_9EUKA|nr:MAG: putative Serine/threonine-protein kinase ATG1a [Streblomastix strix]